MGILSFLCVWPGGRGEGGDNLEMGRRYPPGHATTVRIQDGHPVLDHFHGMRSPTHFFGLQDEEEVSLSPSLLSGFGKLVQVQEVLK